ncbi:hypothetical protein D3C80_245340 [compost metagenome]
MRITIIFLVAFLFSACSRDIRFVRVNEQLPQRPPSLECISVKDLEATVIEKTIIEQEVAPQVDDELPIIHPEYQSKKTIRKVEMPDEYSQGSLTQIISAKKNQQLSVKQQEKLNKRINSLSEKYKAASPPPPQNAKTLTGASLMIVGAFLLVAGIFAIFGSPIGLWAILLGGALILIGGAILVSGSMGSRHRK